MSKMIISIILILTAGAAVFSTIRYNDIVRQNNILRNKLNNIADKVTALQKKLDSTQKLTNEDNYLPPDYYDLKEEKIAKLGDERLSKALSQNPDSTASPNLPNNQGTQAQSATNNSAVREEVRKAIQEMTEDFFRSRGRRREDRVMSLLESELALNPAQKEAIQKLIDEQNDAISNIWSKRREPGFDFDQSRQDMQKVRQDTEAKVKLVLDSSQSAKFDQLKADSRLNYFSGEDRGRRLPRGQQPPQ